MKKSHVAKSNITKHLKSRALEWINENTSEEQKKKILFEIQVSNESTFTSYSTFHAKNVDNNAERITAEGISIISRFMRYFNFDTSHGLVYATP